MRDIVSKLKDEECKLAIYHTALKFAINPTAEVGIIDSETEKKMNHYLVLAFLAHFSDYCGDNREYAEAIANTLFHLNSKRTA